MFHDCVKRRNRAAFLGVITSLGPSPYGQGLPYQPTTRPWSPHTFDFHEAMAPQCRAASPRATDPTSRIQPPHEPRAAPMGRYHTTTLPRPSSRPSAEEANLPTTQVARNFPRSVFESPRNRCNSNDMNSNVEIVRRELRATLLGNHSWSLTESTWPPPHPSQASSIDENAHPCRGGRLLSRLWESNPRPIHYE